MSSGTGVEFTAPVWLDEAADDDRLARIAWAHIAEPRDAKAHLLISELGYGAALLAVAERAAALEAFARRLAVLDLPEQLRRCRTVGVRILAPGDAEWPDRLDDLGEPPHCLFVSGEADVKQATERSVSMVGARAATHYGQRLAADLAAGVSARGYSVISGGAFGIDAAAHRGALSGGAGTVCVVAGGVDRAYPAAHDALFSAVKETGAVVGEMPLGFSPMRQRFLHRNRLIAALSPGTVVVEAGLRSGSLSTARRAAELCRTVGAVPGPVTSPASAGCHELVREGAAVLVTSVAQVLELVAPIAVDGETFLPIDEMPVRPEDELHDVTKMVWDALPVRRACPLENVVRTSGRTLEETRAALGELLARRMAVRQDGLWRKA